MTLKVQRKSCSTCIFRQANRYDIPRLLAQIADPHMKGFFIGHRQCHHSNDAVCAGFWARYKDKFTMGQVAQRMGFVEYVNHDTLKEKSMHPQLHSKPGEPRRWRRSPYWRPAFRVLPRQPSNIDMPFDASVSAIGPALRAYLAKEA